VVTNCDHLIPLCGRQPKGEVDGKPFPVALHRLIQCFGGHPVQLGQVRVQDHPFPAEQEEAPFDGEGRDDGRGDR
jgi:hypothetical protein